MQPTDGIIVPYTELHKVFQELRETIKEALDACPKLPSVDSVITLSTAPSQLHRNKHRYSLLFLSEATTFMLDIPGIGQFPLTLGIGWNELSVPDGTETALVGDSMSALYRCTDTLE